MTTATVRSGFDAWVGSGKPSAHHYATTYLSLESGAAETYVYFRNPAPRGATITSAILRFRAQGSSSGSRTLTARRASKGWTQTTLNWNNRPGVTGTARTVAIGTLAHGATIDVNVTGDVQLMTDGAANYGWKITTTGGTRHYLGALQHATNKPVLIVTWSDAPDAPTTLNPSGSVISLAKPTVQCDYADVSGSTTLAGINVQIDADMTGAPDFDSGDVATTEPELDLSTTAYAGLAAGASTNWRVRVKDGAGLWSAWSDWATITRQDKPTLTLTNPTIAAPYVYETTPPIMWTLSATQEAWQVRITTAADRSRVLYDTKKKGGTDNAHTPPAGILKDAGAYSLNVRAWDTYDREASPGDDTFVEQWLDFTVHDDPLTDPVDTLTATARGRTPVIDLAFTRDTAPDSFTIYRDGVSIAADLLPVDLLDDGVYRYADFTATPNRDHVYSVRPVVTGRQSEPALTATASTSPEGVWLMDLDRDLFLTLWGDDEGEWRMDDEAEVFTPRGGDRSIRIVDAMHGFEGGFSSLVLAEGFGQTYDEAEATLYAIKEQPTRVIRMVASDVNIPVTVGDIVPAPTPITRRGAVVRNVAFNFWQAGELPFTYRS